MVLNQHYQYCILLRHLLRRAHAQHGTGDVQKPEGPLLPGLHFWDLDRVYDSCRGSMPHASSRKMSHFLPDGLASLQMGKAGSRAHRQLISAGRPSAGAPVRIAGAKSILSGVWAQSGPGQDTQLASALTQGRLCGALSVCILFGSLLLPFQPDTPTLPTPHTLFLASPAPTVLALMPKPLSLSKWRCPF